MSHINKLFVAFILLCSCVPLFAQDQKPLTNQEFVKLLYQLPRSPETRDDLIEQIRRRGIGFPLTDGMRGLVATKSSNDALLRRTLEEAERRSVHAGSDARVPRPGAGRRWRRAGARSPGQQSGRSDLGTGRHTVLDESG